MPRVPVVHHWRSALTLLRRWLHPRGHLDAVREAAVFLRRHHRVVFEMARDDLTGRYKGQWFGSAWVIVHPLAITAVYLFIFGVVFAQRMGGTRELPLDYTTYILSGLLPWLTFQMSMTTAVNAVVANAGLVKQFIFPIELLPIRDVASSTLTFVVGIAATLLYVVLTQATVLPTWLLLPVVFAVQVVAMLGVALLLSAAAVFFRDLKDLLTLFTLVALFLMPVVYLPGWVPRVFQPILWINPFTYMTWVYQDVIYFGRFEHPWAWPIFGAWAVMAFAAGYRLFRKTKPLFGAVL